MTNNIWEIFDFSSMEASLNVQGKTRYKTRFGALMSILALISVSVLSVYFFVIYLEKNEVNVLYTIESKESISYLDLNKKPFIFKLSYIDGSLMDPRIATFTVTYRFYSNASTTGSILKVEPCAWGQNLDENYKDLLKNEKIETFSCLTQDRPLNLTYDPFKNIKFFFGINVHTCNNSTANKNHCMSPAIISDVLSKANLYFGYYFPSLSIDHYNSTHPIQESV